MNYRVALIEWEEDGGGIGEAIYEELIALGHEPTLFPIRAYTDFILSGETDVVMMFGPFGKFIDALSYAAQMSIVDRPITVFWNTEGLPDLKTPWPLMKSIAHLRSLIGRQVEQQRALTKTAGIGPLLHRIDASMIRYRHLGDFLYAQKKGLLDIYADVSAVYAHFLRRRAGFDPIAAPFGSFHKWHEDLDLRRDIDIMWMGKRATKRRSNLLDRVRSELKKRGVELMIFDNEEKPFIFGQERTEMLNRSKISLNLLRTWYDENSLRFCMAAPNRSLIVSEPLLPHVPNYEPGVHYVSAQIGKLADTIVYYLENEAARQQIVDNAYQLMMSELTFRGSVRKLMEKVAEIRMDEPELGISTTL